MLQYILAGYLPLSPADVAFDYEVHGKPRLSAKHAEPGLEFNLAYSHEPLICAVAEPACRYRRRAYPIRSGLGADLGCRTLSP